MRLEVVPRFDLIEADALILPVPATCGGVCLHQMAIGLLFGVGRELPGQSDITAIIDIEPLSQGHRIAAPLRPVLDVGCHVVSATSWSGKHTSCYATVYMIGLTAGQALDRVMSAIVQLALRVRATRFVMPLMIDDSAFSAAGIPECDYPQLATAVQRVSALASNPLESLVLAVGDKDEGHRLRKQLRDLLREKPPAPPPTS